MQNRQLINHKRGQSLGYGGGIQALVPNLGQKQLQTSETGSGSPAELPGALSPGLLPAWFM